MSKRDERGSGPSASLYRLHGLRIASDLALDPFAAPGVGRPDVTLVSTLGARIPEGRPEGRLLAERTDLPTVRTLTTDERGYLLRYHGLIEFRLSPGLDRVEVRAGGREARRMAPVLTAGPALAVLLALQETESLHASAVAREGEAVAFAAPSGRGKSTLAATCCAVGASLLTDDVLRLEAAERGEIRAWPGTRELRLREDAGGLADRFPAGRVRRTSDGRTGVRPPGFAAGPVPLRAIVVPRPDRGAGRLTVERLSPTRALVEILSATRVVGWAEKERRRRQFRFLERIVRCVPVHRVRLPWSVPLAPGLVKEMLDRVGIGRIRSAS